MEEGVEKSYGMNPKTMAFYGAMEYLKARQQAKREMEARNREREWQERQLKAKAQQQSVQNMMNTAKSLRQL